MAPAGEVSGAELPGERTARLLFWSWRERRIATRAIRSSGLGGCASASGDRADPGALWLPHDPRAAQSRGLEGGKDLVYRLYKEEGLGLRKRPAGRRRAVVHRQERFKPTGPNQVWAMDFVSDQLCDGRRFRSLTVVDIYTRRLWPSRPARA